MSKVTGGIAKGITTVGGGVAGAGASVVGGFGAGFAGLVSHTIDGTRSGGAVGFLKGLGRGTSFFKSPIHATIPTVRTRV